VSVESTVAEPLIRGSAVLLGTACVTAEPPDGSTRTVASDARAAAASVQRSVVLRVERIGSFLSSDVTTTV
jgi:hypothetical protein